MLEIHSPEKHDKGWGYELWIDNRPEYCGKILHFNSKGKGSLHYHLKKTESWYVLKGQFTIEVVDTLTGELKYIHMVEGSCLTVLAGVPHRIYSPTGGDILEVSSTHFEDDSYRISPGDSQLLRAV